MSSQFYSPPVAFYPNAVTAQPSSHSKGSFGPVFAVLAVVIVLSAVACIVGQLCARRCSNPKPPKRDSHPKQSKRDSRPKPSKRESHLKQPRKNHNFPDEDDDIEFGFQPRMPTGKPGGRGEPRGQKPADYGENKGETKFAEDAKNAYW